jgi:hypothetical protein
MRKLIAAVLLLTTNTAWAGEDLVSVPIAGTSMVKKCRKDDAERCAMVLPAGEKAPYPGALLTFREAASLTANAEATKERVAQEVKLEMRLAKVEVNRVTDKAHADKEAHDKIVADLKQKLVDSQPGFFEKPVVIVVITALTTLGLAALSIAGAQKLRN